MDLNDRQRTILDLVRQSGLQSITDLSRQFDVATQTIRRDINALCDEGLARRVHGGVVAPSNPVNLNFRSRRVMNEGAKRAIGQAAAQLIPQGATVMLGIGTTVQYVAEALLEHSDLTVVTNNLEVATIFCGSVTAEVHFTAGVLRPEDRDVVGGQTLLDYQRFRADFGVIGAGGLSPNHGLLDYKSIDADVSRMILQQSRQALLVADAGKWNRSPKFQVAGFDRIDTMVTNEAPPCEIEGLSLHHVAEQNL
ncbi:MULTISPECIES: DeoR/GlpR family DNA-binding transcription regulator [unclassified Ruegeria]|uniref:DeoR/GlpR family DNA-binding transcription regulator n=1 Tax=unclassified Ruegeria TaxID=2625375 RepID=UPI0014893B2C|nr:MULTISPECIES: DeoR/GlpR family DNA-binding transcription regulator [unclassified Ruegeria]NOD64257.1 DeoR family transcriptional regulator [Ruegeria sp. HKCCD6109]